MNKNELLIFLLALITGSACNTIPDTRDGIVQEEFIYEKAPYPSCHAPTIAETPVGLVTAFLAAPMKSTPMCAFM